MTKIITSNKAKREARNAKIKERYEAEISNGGMKSAIIESLAKSNNLTIPTIYAIIK